MALFANPLLAAYGFGRAPRKAGRRWIYPAGNEVMAPGTDMLGLYGSSGQQAPGLLAQAMPQVGALNANTPELGPPVEMPGMTNYAGLLEGQLPDNPWARSPGIVADDIGSGGISGMESQGGQNPWMGMTPEAMAALGQSSPWQGMTPEAMSATRPQRGGLFSGMKGISNWQLPLLQAGLGMMEAGGWQKMPVTLGQAAGRGGIPAIGTKIRLDEQAKQDEYRQEQLAQMRMGREAYAEQQRMLAEKAKYERQLSEDQQKLYTQLQGQLASGDMEGAKKTAQLMAFRQNGAAAYKEVFGSRDEKGAETRIIDGRVKQWNPQTDRYDIDLGEAPEKGPLVGSIGLRMYEGEMDKGMAQRANAAIETGAKAAGDYGRATQMERAASAWERMGGTWGPAGPAQETFSRGLASVGIDPTAFGLPKNAGPAETIQAMSNQMTVAAIGNEKGEGGMPANNFTEADREFVRSMFAQLDNSREGFKAKLAMYKAIKRREQEYALEIKKAQLRGKTPEERLANVNAVELEWIESKRERPLFSQDEMDKFFRITKRAPQNSTQGFRNRIRGAE